MTCLRRLHGLLWLALIRSREAGAGPDTGGIGEQVVIRGLIIAAAVVVVGIIVAAVITHAHAIANSITGAGN